MELTECPSCGTKNVSNRTTCLSCNGSFASPVYESQPWFEAFAATHLSVISDRIRLITPRSLVAITTGIVFSYFVFTWFFFGSSHPCGILWARQRPYVLARIDKTRAESIDRYFKLLDKIREVGGNSEMEVFFMEKLAEAINEKRTDEHLTNVWKSSVSRLTPSVCLWKAMAWNANPYRD
jgi:hypothetical protein